MGKLLLLYLQDLVLRLSTADYCITCNCYNRAGYKNFLLLRLATVIPVIMFDYSYLCNYISIIWLRPVTAVVRMCPLFIVQSANL